ncbi:MAG: hypothetical protein WB763_00245 [Terriglobia bacterium]|jgi:hypothetical protein
MISLSRRVVSEFDCSAASAAARDALAGPALRDRPYIYLDTT